MENTDICPKCNLLARVGKNFYSVENGDTETAPTKLYMNIEMLCMNPDCSNYAGEDIQKPKTIVHTIKNELEVVPE